MTSGPHWSTRVKSWANNQVFIECLRVEISLPQFQATLGKKTIQKHVQHLIAVELNMCFKHTAITKAATFNLKIVPYFAEV